MTTEFSQLGLKPQLVQAISDLGYVTPTPIQSEVIPLMLEGRDVIGQAQTGTGKTAAFVLPILQNLEWGKRDIQASHNRFRKHSPTEIDFKLLSL